MINQKVWIHIGISMISKSKIVKGEGAKWANYVNRVDPTVDRRESVRGYERSMCHHPIPTSGLNRNRTLSLGDRECQNQDQIRRLIRFLLHAQHKCTGAERDLRPLRN